MSTVSTECSNGSVQTLNTAWRAGSARTWWADHREASLNWLAFGLLLAAWNASDNDPATDMRRRPDSFRGYAQVSVRAAVLRTAELRPASTT
jgi:hypothetical protein